MSCYPETSPSAVRCGIAARKRIADGDPGTKGRSRPARSVLRAMRRRGIVAEIQQGATSPSCAQVITWFKAHNQEVGQWLLGFHTGLESKFVE
jgi:hypothetical protein